MRAPIRSFALNRSGNVAMIFALALVPMMGIAGMAIDYGRSIAVRTSIQSAVDSTALAISKDAAGLTSAQLQQKADTYFRAVFHEPSASNVQVTAQYTTQNGSAVSVSGSASIATSLLGIIGIQKIDLGASSQTTWGTRKLEVALVLDNTGSMAGSGKIQALIGASHQFVNSLQAAATKTGSIKVAIVPFDTDVNVGTASNGQPWIDWSGYYDESTFGSGPDAQNNGSGPGNCYNCGNNDPDNQDNDDCDDNCKKKKKKNKKKKDDAAAGGGPVVYPTWKGCVTDRTQDYDVQNTAPTGDPKTLYPSADCTLAAILPLTDNWSGLNSEIDLMHAAGNTNLTAGLVWGWNMLTPNVPLSAAAPASTDLDKYIIFLTDGLNTQNRWTTDPVQIDSRTKLICDNIKKTGVKLFTIRVMDGNASLLQYCATNVNMYYNVTQASQISSVFSDIMSKLTVLRLAR